MIKYYHNIINIYSMIINNPENLFDNPADIDEEGAEEENNPNEDIPLFDQGRAGQVVSLEHSERTDENHQIEGGISAAELSYPELAYGKEKKLPVEQEEARDNQIRDKIVNYLKVDNISSKEITNKLAGMPDEDVLTLLHSLDSLLPLVTHDMNAKEARDRLGEYFE